MYRAYEPDWQAFIQKDFTLRHFNQMEPQHFSFLWYVYNRGGVCNATTVALFFKKSHRSQWKKLHYFLDRKWLKPLFDPSVYQTGGRGRKPQIYRVSNQFLRGVDNPNSQIRRIRDIRKAMAPLAICNLFLVPEYQPFKLVNRTSRGAFLTERFSLNEDHFPRYFVGKGSRDYVTSCNNEIAFRGEQCFLVWYPETHFGNDFSAFTKKWARVLDATQGRIQCLVITHNPATRAYFQKVTAQNPRPNQTPLDPDLEKKQRISRIVSGASGQPSHKAQKSTLSIPIETLHYPDIYRTYGGFFERPS